MSTVQETTPTIGILGRCCVLEYNDYTTQRPTEIPETDTYLCESVYDEFNKQIRKIQGPGVLKKFTHSQSVTVDEIYHFRRPITVQKVSFLLLFVETFEFKPGFVSSILRMLAAQNQNTTSS